MLYKLGRGMQLFGLVVTPLGMAGNLADPVVFNLWYSLGVAGVGVLVFTLGWLLQQATRPE